MVIRGGNEGGLDGVDVWGTNIWVHDIEVTNKDECVTVKVIPLHSVIAHQLNLALTRVLQATFWSKTSFATGLAAALLAL
jgi:hypothetical protein